MYVYSISVLNKNMHSKCKQAMVTELIENSPNLFYSSWGLSIRLTQVICICISSYGKVIANICMDVSMLRIYISIMKTLTSFGDFYVCYELFN